MYSLESYLLEIRKLLRSTNHRVRSPRTSRAREMEQLAERFQTEPRRGRIVSQRGTETPTTDSGELDDDGMGGCKLLLSLLILFPSSFVVVVVPLG